MNDELKTDIDAIITYCESNCSCDLDVGYICPECHIAKTVDNLVYENRELQKAIKELQWTANRL